jgi:hypothetical protein
MNYKIFIKHIRFKIIILGFFLSFITIIATTPIHEGGHWIMSEIDPYIIPVEYHIFNNIKKNEEPLKLNSPLGYVIIKEKYPGSMKNRPTWANILQEVICISCQILISFIITIKSIMLIENRLKKKVKI